ncbi:recombinase family protein [Shimia thalassica]|uniref:recombinase family protein n=1 Tax=Shimia thalassica TaxID=1715693 RepID=UPI0026E15FFB|nr:recombinase family protein [Shimia thalassica]MDO6799200.1 recombinase family protein [Shimia thalassica]
MKKIAVIYARSATADRSAILTQILECAKRAAEEGILIAGIFHEDGHGAKDDRPGFQRMMDFLRSRQGEKTVVLMDSPARISRKIDQYQQVQAAFDELNVECWDPIPPRDVAAFLKGVFEAMDKQRGRRAGRKATKNDK